jgi:perosamine synthetase
MGEGGAITTDDEGLATRLRELANLAFDPVPERRFIHTALSHNYRLSSLQAAMGLAQLDHWEELLEMRRHLRSMYRDILTTIPGVRLPQPDERSVSSYWASTILLEDSVPVSIPELQKRLTGRGIDTRRFFYPLHQQPALAGKHRQAGDRLPVSESLFEKGLYLPSSSKLTWDQVKLIGSELRQCLV